MMRKEGFLKRQVARKLQKLTRKTPRKPPIKNTVELIFIALNISSDTSEHSTCRLVSNMCYYVLRNFYPVTLQSTLPS